MRTRTVEAYSKHYTMDWPHEENQSGRPCRQSPLYETLKDQGACFGEKLGWERPNWFADAVYGETAQDVYSFDRQNWFNAVGREHNAVRKTAVLFDQSSFAKFSLKALMPWKHLAGSLPTMLPNLLDHLFTLKCLMIVAALNAILPLHV